MRALQGDLVCRRAEGGEQVTAFVDEVIAEAEAQSDGVLPPVGNSPSGSPDAFGAAPEDRFEPPPEPRAEHEAPETAPEQTPVAAHPPPVEPETIEDAPPLVPPMEHGAPDDDAAEHESDDVETYAARRRRMRSRRKQAKRSSRWTAVILVLFAVNVAVIGGRSEVVRYLPQTASLFAAIGLPVNLQNLKFENVRIMPSGAGGEGLTVEGTIVSTADKPVTVPHLRFAVRNAAAQEIYTWSAAPSRSLLDAGAKLDFRSELASPPANAKDVLVRFMTARDAAEKTAGAAKPGPAASHQ